VYKIILRRNSQKYLLKLQKQDRSRINAVISELKQNPRPHGIDKVKGTELWRIREGNFRIIYFIDDRNQTIIVVAIGHRKEIYRDL
jgi:mRNA interferase RelE/StbE